MSEVALLILDECHHCKKKHPANLIMQQFWHPAPPQARPRIFGMTASPVDTKQSADAAFKGLFLELEANLGAKVCTAGLACPDSTHLEGGCMPAWQAQ